MTTAFQQAILDRIADEQQIPVHGRWIPTQQLYRYRRRIREAREIIRVLTQGGDALEVQRVRGCASAWMAEHDQ